MQKNKKQTRLLALAVSITVILSLVSTYTFAATTVMSDSKIKTATEISEMSKALSVPSDVS
ncbi:MAG: hypothetical protein J6C16_02150, partial [Clostridia bacterium]|nr:hypothetical protein [Clostridia bacterium]